METKEGGGLVFLVFTYCTGLFRVSLNHWRKRLVLFLLQIKFLT